MSLSTEHGAVERIRLIASTSLTGLMVLEYTWNIRFEVRVIWPQFWKSAEAKIFVIARYMGLAGQIFNVWFASRMASGIPTHPLVCRVCYSFHGITIQCLLMSVELLLILLACKMYNNDRFVLGLLYALVGVQWAGMAITVRLLVSDLRPSPTCALESNSSQIYVGASAIATNFCFLAVILWRYFRVKWPEILCSYLKIMVRNSICAVILVTGNFLVLILTPMEVHTPVRGIFFPVMIFSFWFAVGRLVLDKEKFRQQFQNDYELTEVDIDNLEPLDDSDVYPARPFDSKVTELSIAVDPELGVGIEGDIADERIYDWVNDASPSSFALTIMPMETGNGTCSNPHQ
ncbi:hypothetical protein K503DRAFT_859599 [Rhizopogon vinicolor AM-OR11-026]|uniref:Uncharacterized protein n=1 Tax=Rhizopogon vinicolor AM-OR11-026 TaxID=1314800 RepID=A0A1B7MMC5_9AGAM|nr:hypothetical protein K503DRAFT_859599 [Rhizopogon vinicolor AM-OR11-026]